MKPSSLISPIAVFAAALMITASLSSYRFGAPLLTGSRKQTSVAVHAGSKRDSAESIRTLLRAGDIAGARRLMEELAGRDPVEFFALLAKLPLIKEFDAAVTTAAGKLTWDDPEAIKTLELTACPHWRHLAWDSYTAAQIGKVSDEEILRVADKANCFTTLQEVSTLLDRAAKERPLEFARNLKGMETSLIRSQFLVEVALKNPEFTDEIFALVYAEPTDASTRFEMMQYGMRGKPSPENLIAMLNKSAPNGVFSHTLAPIALSSACQNSSPEMREHYYAAIEQLPPLARNRMIEAIRYGSSEWKQSPEEFCRALAISSSRSSQMDILRDWIQGAKHLEGDAWIEGLPGEDLKAEARRLMAEKAQE
jgi:hypothetical protein